MNVCILKSDLIQLKIQFLMKMWIHHSRIHLQFSLRGHPATQAIMIMRKKMWIHHSHIHLQFPLRGHPATQAIMRKTIALMRVLQNPLQKRPRKTFRQATGIQLCHGKQIMTLTWFHRL
ncbi:uncharacterized protein LOC125253448 isoform X2 [Megalobrama amblycephala]|nr:uncharacterized protein LOC125253448 isoform X2 [Megalobrama amblycephala]